jgi:hypothetical protein
MALAGKSEGKGSLGGKQYFNRSQKNWRSMDWVHLLQDAW